MHELHDRPFGAALLPGSGVRFRLWAPGVAQVLLRFDENESEQLTMQPQDGGWHERIVPQAGPGTRYRFVLPDGLAVPDPASRSNPDDVHGASMVTDPRAYRWQDGSWRGRPWHEAVVYELHIGSFTPQGSYAAAAARLPDLAALGITAVELMPLADFPGRRGWGYDGVLPFAPDAAYGTPDALKHFVDTAHRLGLMMLLDVVYNHFGPEGNYLHAYGPGFFNPAHATPWGAAINFDAEPHRRTVRDFFVHNARYWIEEFHFDGLRLDAVHAIHDDSPEHIVCEIARALRDGPGRTRHVHLVLENDDNAARLLGGGHRADAQWNDDFHHAAHVLATGQTDGYYADYAHDPVARLGRALAQGFIYQGDPSAFRQGTPRGEPSAHLPSTAFVSFLQNHDQVGNRAFGERLHHLAPAPRVEALLACLLLSPQVPLLFMGEEFAASSPFLYFCDFGPELAAAVSAGRREEFGRFEAFQDPAARARIPDPNAEATFIASRIDWSERDGGPHAQRLVLVRELLALRRQWLTPRLPAQPHGGRFSADAGLLRVAWTLSDGARLHLAAHFGEHATTMTSPLPGRPVFALRADSTGLAPDGVRVHLEEDRPHG